jgi:hypothetical protein
LIKFFLVMVSANKEIHCRHHKQSK